jgi:Fe-S cluster assembly ATP-binding protein
VSDLLLRLEGLSVSAEGREILHDLDLAIPAGELHVVMGPNGAGKSTLAHAIAGDPRLRVERGRIVFQGDDVTSWSPDVRAKAGIFLAFQQPEAIPGVPMVQFLRRAMSARSGTDLSMLELRLSIGEWLEKLGMDPGMADRHVNDGFSGGERKRAEVLQLALLEPELVVLDETDSGLDVDALQVVARTLQSLLDQNERRGALLITHHERFLRWLEPDGVHILADGRLVAHGGPGLAQEVASKGFDQWRRH